MPRIRDVEAHLAALRESEPSLNRDQLAVIREIIHLRRGIESPSHMACLRALIDEGGQSLLESLSTRWLISITDTFADHGTAAERGNAIAITVLANVTRMAETERLFLTDASVDESKRETYVMPGAPLWDGMVSYAIRHGDMPINMWTRMRSLLTATPILLSIFEIVLSRMLESDTVVGRLSSLNPNFSQLAEPFPYWKLVG
jgi:hypothetical protein